MAVEQGLRYTLLLTLFSTFTYSLFDGYFMENFLANTCDLQDDDVVMFSTSYTECILHCKGISECTAVNVMEKVAMCRLNFNVNETVACQGYQYSLKANWKQDDPRECGCSKNQTCQRNGGCVASACSKQQPPEHGKLYQQRVRVGDKISYQCKPGYILDGQRTLQCQNDGTWSGPSPTCTEDPACRNYLVGGATGVGDGQLNASTNWCDDGNDDERCQTGIADLTPKFARINRTGYYTDAWAAGVLDTNQFIQIIRNSSAIFGEYTISPELVVKSREVTVNFLKLRTVSAIALQGRAQTNQFVTCFKVKYSRDCDVFVDVTDENGDSKSFDGNTNPTDVVVQRLPERVVARCVRINPTVWNDYISLRFDVLGC